MFPGVQPEARENKVAMAFEESVRYSLTGAEDEDEWYYAFPIGKGSVRLGSKYRPFFLAMYHENHCLQQFRDALARKQTLPDWNHIHHCLNYLREWSLCEVDLTLEPGDFAKRDFTLDRSGEVHVCHDWTAVMNAVDADWDKWVPIWKQFQNNSVMPQNRESTTHTMIEVVRLILMHLLSLLELWVEISR